MNVYLGKNTMDVMELGAAVNFFYIDDKFQEQNS